MSFRLDRLYRPTPIRVSPLGPDQWQASQVFYPFGANGIPDQEPGFREWAWGWTPRAAVVALFDEIKKRGNRNG